MRLKNYLVLLLLLISIVPARSQDKILTIDQLKEDYDIFRGALETMHGGLYRYRTKAEIDQSFAKLKTAINQPMTDLAYFRLLSPVITKIQCGHTGISPPKPVWERIFNNKKLLPIKLYFLDRKAYFVKSNTEESLPISQGDEVLAINGLSIDSLIDYSYTVHSIGDGWINTGKLSLLNSVFNKYFALHFSQPDEYEITYVNSDSKTNTFKVTALHEEDMVNFPINNHQVSRHIDLRFENETTAMLSVKSFDNWKDGKKKVKFIKYLEKVFLQIDSAKVSNLIVDVRDNGGGDDEMGLKLFSYLHNQPIVEFNEIVFKSKKLHYAEHSESNKFIFWLAKTFNKYKRINDSTYQIVNNTTKPHSPSKPQFKGNLIVLINGRSYSTTADFAALIKSYDKAILVGEETSGGYYGNTSGAILTYLLPNSGIKINVPLLGYWTNVKDDIAPGRGTLPTYQVVPSVQDVIEGKDTQMDFALTLIADQDR